MRAVSTTRFRVGIAAVAIAVAFVATPPRLAAQTPDAGRWETLPAGERPTMRHEHGYVKVGGRFYLVGGRGEKPVEIFDPATRTWTAGAAPPIELHHFQALEHDGKVWVVGAMTGGWPKEPPVPEVHIYDPATDRWTRGPSIPSDRRRGGAGAVVHEGRIYVVAGITNGHTSGHVAWLDVLDPRTGTWQRLADAPRPRDHFQAGVIDGKLYVAGGRRSSAGTNQHFELVVPEVDVYDFRTNAWTTLPPASNIPTPRAGSTTVVLDGRLVVIGGESGAQEAGHAEVEALDPRTGRWTALAPMNTGRHAAQAVLHDGRIWIAAGSRTRGATEVASQEVYTPAPGGSSPRGMAPVDSARLDTALRAELVRLGEQDQADREGVGAAMASNDTAFMFRMMRNDSARTRRLREIVRAHGWPGPALVGKDGTHAAFLILQHGGALDLQRELLPDLWKAAERGEMPKQEVAMLEDRVMGKIGRPQRWGHAFTVRDGRLVADPIEDLPGLDARRASLGLPPMSVYVKALSEMYGMPVVWPPAP